MIDPASAIALATTAFSGIKRAVAAGKEISELGKDISSFGRAVSDLDYMGNKAKDPPLWRKLDPKFDTSAIEIWAHQQRAKEMREELREYISLTMGHLHGKPLFRSKQSSAECRRKLCIVGKRR